LSGDPEQSTDIGIRLAGRLKAQGAQEILSAVEANPPEPVSHP
jgi:hypothetical protein